MLAHERQELILKRIEADGMVKSIELAKDFKVTNETIRKDLELLAQEKRVMRIHGGATRVSDTRYDLPLPARQAVNRYVKSIVAQEATKLITPNSTVFLDASSTVLMMTETLPKIPLTVLTNAHHVIVALGGKTHCDLICTGGIYEEKSRSYVGAMAEDALKRYVIEWLFLGVDGLDHAMGASEVNPGQAVLKERLIPRAENVCIVCDSSKLGKKSPFIFASIQQIDYLVTDDRASEAQIRQMESEGIKVIQAHIPDKEA
ncbi:MAG: DeoR/GlpR transcriptional regulator [Opitutales bacterium]|nr:DeoR/GlpR transcriptional regulator [Opitutales bacterium]